MPTEAIEIRDAQAQLTELVPRVIAGAEVVLTDGRKTVARLVPIAGARGGVRQAGLHGGPSRWPSWGAIKMAEHFNEPLPDEFWTGAA
jgi:antitoxin (DNA-binding transcriptional repressor) of toxin-antitoxin stability system